MTSQNEESRRAFETHIIGRKTDRWGQDFLDEHRITWQASEARMREEMRELVEAFQADILVMLDDVRAVLDAPTYIDPAANTRNAVNCLQKIEKRFSRLRKAGE